MKHVTISLFVLIALSVQLSAQISTNETPVSFNLNMVALRSDQAIQTKTMQSINLEQIASEDEADEANGIPPRFGYPLPVNYTFQNSGTWVTLPNGDKIWQLSIQSPGALSINLLYDAFWLPNGAKFFVYSDDKQHVLGAFTSINNKGDRNNPQGFATGLVYSDSIIVEYYEPADVIEDAIISIAYVVHGYRYIKLPESMESGYGESGNCQVNINCIEGKDWQQEKNAVAMILVNGYRYCTGSLINTTANDNRSLFLTADHCLGDWANDYVKYDAITNPNLSHYSFYWHYESPGCNNTISPSVQSTVGATIVANNSISDFALLNLTEDPRNITGVTPYYLGWDRTGNTGTSGVGIHHPNGDVKKIATLNNATTSSGNFWRHYWSQTTNGYSVTEGGSSGSPLLNNDHRIIGQLYGGPSLNCSNPSQDYAMCGKFSVSWTGNGASDNRLKLQPWLDPLGTNPTTLDGKGFSPTLSGPSTMCAGTPTTFTVTNAPAGYTWSSSANLALVSTSGNTASFLANADGSAWVGIQVAGVEVARRNVTVGMQAGGISGPYDLSCGCLVQIDHPGEYRFYATNVPSNLTLMQVRWELTPPNDSFLALFSGKSPMIGFGGGGIYTLKMKWEGECGFSPYAVRNILVWGPSNNDDGRGIVLSAYPNPASSVIYIKLEEESQATLQSRQSSLSPADVYRVQLVAVQTRAVALNQTISNYSGYLELNVSSIPEGLYSLVLIRNDTILHTETILIQL